jgi:peptidoglycan/xylan/chitin deacetylase (PgdA/CDA1 family)
MNTQTATPTEHHQHPRTTRTSIAWCIAMILAVLPSVFVMSPGRAADGPQTVVSLTFDDGNANQLSAATIMKDHGMPGTFYVNSGSVGKAAYFTRNDLTQLAADGNEIGGHTLSHVNLPGLPSDEAKRQICLDRANLTEWGFSVRSFSYPFAETTPAIGNLVRDCGYNSGRNVGDIRSRFGCDDCSFSEAMPPSQPYSTKAHNVDSAWTLQDFQDAVTNAESSGGGWVQLTFHNFCGSTCGELSVSEEIFTQFLDWLEPRAASNNTIVKTVGDVVGGAAQPVVMVGDPVPIQDESGLNNPSLETLAASTGLPQCWQAGGYGTNTATVDTVTPGRTGQIAGRVTVSNFGNGDAKLITARDLGTCAPSVTPGKSYVLRGWYTSTAATQFDVYLRNASGGWSYWTSSPFFAASPTYTPATWTTPAVPAGSTGISFGLNLVGNGTLTADDFTFSATDSVPRTYATVAPAAPDGAAGWYKTHPKVTLTVDRGSESAATEYSVDDGTTWTAYTAPFDAPDTQKLSYRSTSGSLVEVTRTLDLKVDTTLPVVTPTFDETTRTLTVTATDMNGSGIALIERRTVGDTAWTPVTGPEVLGSDSAELELRATDNAGNGSATETLNVLNGPAEPTVTLGLGSSLTYGKANTATITVAVPAGRATPTGTVTIKDGTKAIASKTLSGGTVAISLSTLGAGTRRLTASYAGDTETKAGISAVQTVTVKKATPTVTFALSTSRPKAKSTKVKVTVNLRIAGSSVRPAGTVYIRLNGKTIKTMTIWSSYKGTRAVRLPAFTKKGTFKLSVRYQGSPNVSPRTSSKTIYVR